MKGYYKSWKAILYKSVIFFLFVFSTTSDLKANDYRAFQSDYRARTREYNTLVEKILGDNGSISFLKKLQYDLRKMKHAFAGYRSEVNRGLDLVASMDEAQNLYDTISEGWQESAFEALKKAGIDENHPKWGRLVRKTKQTLNVKNYIDDIKDLGNPEAYVEKAFHAWKNAVKYDLPKEAHAPIDAMYNPQSFYSITVGFITVGYAELKFNPKNMRESEKREYKKFTAAVEQFGSNGKNFSRHIKNIPAITQVKVFHQIIIEELDTAYLGAQQELKSLRERYQSVKSSEAHSPLSILKYCRKNARQSAGVYSLLENRMGTSEVISLCSFLKATAKKYNELVFEIQAINYERNKVSSEAFRESMGTATFVDVNSWEYYMRIIRLIPTLSKLVKKIEAFENYLTGNIKRCDTQKSNLYPYKIKIVSLNKAEQDEIDQEVQKYIKLRMVTGGCRLAGDDTTAKYLNLSKKWPLAAKLFKDSENKKFYRFEPENDRIAQVDGSGYILPGRGGKTNIWTYRRQKLYEKIGTRIDSQGKAVPVMGWKGKYTPWEKNKKPFVASVITYTSFGHGKKVSTVKLRLEDPPVMFKIKTNAGFGYGKRVKSILNATRYAKWTNSNSRVASLSMCYDPISGGGTYQKYDSMKIITPRSKGTTWITARFKGKTCRWKILVVGQNEKSYTLHVSQNTLKSKEKATVEVRGIGREKIHLLLTDEKLNGRYIPLLFENKNRSTAVSLNQKATIQASRVIIPTGVLVIAKAQGWTEKKRITLIPSPDDIVIVGDGKQRKINIKIEMADTIPLGKKVEVKAVVTGDTGEWMKNYSCYWALQSGAQLEKKKTSFAYNSAANSWYSLNTILVTDQKLIGRSLFIRAEMKLRNVKDLRYFKVTVSSKDLVNELKKVLMNLFTSYEREQSREFIRHISYEFQGLGLSRNKLSRSHLYTSTRDDFKILDGIRFQVFVKSMQIQRDWTKARIELRWSRRALLAQTSEEWILKNQNSTLIFERQKNWKLLTVEGDPLFGLSDFRGFITLSDGTLDGKNIHPPVQIGVTGKIPIPKKEPLKTITLTTDDTGSGQQVDLLSGTVSFYNGCNIKQNSLGIDMIPFESNKVKLSTYRSGNPCPIVSIEVGTSYTGRILTNIGGVNLAVKVRIDKVEVGTPGGPFHITISFPIE